MSKAPASSVLKLLEQEAAASTQYNKRCPVAKVLEIDPDMAEAIDSGYSHAVVTRVLRVQGHNLGANAVSRHRSGGCSC